MKFRKKPVVIEAVKAEAPEIIRTLEGDMVANPGDWIITGVKGERYPCRPDIFELTYDPVLEGETVAVLPAEREVIQRLIQHENNVQASRVQIAGKMTVKASEMFDGARGPLCTLALIKPDAMWKHEGAILQSIVDNRFLPVRMKLCALTSQQAAEFYAEHEGRHFFRSLVDFMSSGVVLAMVLMGDDAIARWRTLMGATDSRKAAQGTIRARFGCPYVLEYDEHNYPMWRNAVHGSDGPEAFERELAFFEREFDL